MKRPLASPPVLNRLRHLGRLGQRWTYRPDPKRRSCHISCSGLNVLADISWRFVNQTEPALPYFPKSDAFNEPRDV